MSFRDTLTPSTSFEKTLQDLLDFKTSVENGDFLAGGLVLDAPLQVGDLLIDAPKDPDTGQTLLTVTNTASGNSVTICSIP